MATENNIILVLCVVGFGFLAVGFNNRDRGWGLAMMWGGLVTMLAPIAWRFGAVGVSGFVADQSHTRAGTCPLPQSRGYGDPWPVVPSRYRTSGECRNRP